MGASAANYDEIVDLADQVVGLKMYLNDTFTTLKLDGMQQWLKVGFVMFLPTIYSLHHLFYFVFNCVISILNTGQRKCRSACTLKVAQLQPSSYCLR